MAKNDRHGQAAILTNSDFVKIRKQFKSQHHRLIFDIARWTGERWGAIVQLRVGDVYENPVLSVPRSEITFTARTRKASPGGQRETRQCPTHPELQGILAAYDPPLSGYLFPAIAHGHITWSAADKAFRGAIVRAGLSTRGISTHSTRRSFITALARLGVDVKTLQAITGHHDVKALLRYVEADPDIVRNAIALL